MRFCRGWTSRRSGRRDRGKLLFGYSDLTCVLNAVYGKTGCACGLYQIRNLLHSQGREQLKSLLKLLKEEGRFRGKTSEIHADLDWSQVRPLTDLSVHFLQASLWREQLWEETSAAC